MTSAGFRSGCSALLLLSSATLSIAQSLVTPESPYTNWTYTGCYTDSVAARTLKGGGYGSGSLTNSQCVEYCATRGFYYAGSEYSTECYCGNSIQNGATQTTGSDCNMACGGNATEACGGPNRLTMFNTTIPAGPVGPFVNPGVNGFRSMGCYTDNGGARTLTVGMATAGGPGSLTVALCTSTCASEGYMYAGVEYAQECCQFPYVRWITPCFFFEHGYTRGHLLIHPPRLRHLARQRWRTSRRFRLQHGLQRKLD
ncbi:WSC-domain-containing protein [Trematosphaeria pertusa]|uniref:WSC-domain-containing protein n=1 Tax=Trematosphaeria pertusa TaxID=390896 RepID=A0A6A6IXU8_9PLEO|nr:WSC-domain-containing protein [Trematosphaeria pertusa]KAF2254450.1 WSC-domain-containing protein [Trematosphaeria pertusa]